MSAAVSFSVLSRRVRLKRFTTAAAGHTCESDGTCSGGGGSTITSNPGDLLTLASASLTEDGFGSAASTATTIFPTASTAPSSNAVVIDLDDPAITWLGSAWTDVPSACNSSAKSKSAGPGNSMMYSWTGLLCRYFFCFTGFSLVISRKFRDLPESFNEKCDILRAVQYTDRAVRKSVGLRRYTCKLLLPLLRYEFGPSRGRGQSPCCRCG